MSGVNSLQAHTSILSIHVHPHCHNTIALSTLQRAIHSKGDKSLILSIVSFIGCFFCTALCCPGVSMLCHIPAMLFAAKSRVSAEKKDYYDSKLMLHWSYICTFAGCFLGWVLLAVGIFFLVVGAISASSR